MTDAAIPDGPPPPEVVEQAKQILEHAELVNIHPVEIRASRTEATGAARDVRVEATAQYSVASGAMSNRFRYQLEIVDGGEQTLAEIDFTLQVDYEVEADYEPSGEGADFLAGTTGLFAVYPYARELAQSLTTRLQLDPLVLGMLPRGASSPSAISQVARPSGPGAEGGV
ncbi:MAG: hypothetical protein ACR2KP_12565 [Egibacteraceae bacterium]